MMTSRAACQGLPPLGVTNQHRLNDTTKEHPGRERHIKRAPAEDPAKRALQRPPTLTSNIC
jgi:hypothetical protein